MGDKFEATFHPLPTGPIAPEELDRQRLLGVTSAGRLRRP